jgi:hypothetical protein
MTLTERIAQRARATPPIPSTELVFGTVHGNGCADICGRPPHDIQRDMRDMHRDAVGHTWGARPPMARWIELARSRPTGLARDFTGRGPAL